ncbi:putative transcriptional repressor NF-X1 [Penaeus vannamei]|uniref:Putative transcriptional repressor NF-X1 n=1 Tax=Penaeus vannamei TaxID=6689 RepID=A0A423SIE0_PENVA|nr:putative transcriptional repressor NF-X1 [Penaeus vannamei]
MAEAGRNSGGMSQPGRGSAYSTNFPSPMTYQPMQVPPFQAGYQDMFVQSYPRVMPISHFQGNVLCQDNSQFQGSGHYQGDNQFQNNSQFQANSQYPSYNHYQNNAHFQGNGHFEGNGHLQGNQYPGNLQYEELPRNPNAIENEAFGGEAKVSPQGNDCEGIINGIASEGGVKNKGMNRGRGGKGRRGGRRNYGTDRLSQGPNMPYTWYEPRGAAYDQDQKKRDRESALAETAAFMQRMSLGRTDNPPTKELDNNDRRSRGGRGRYDWGGSHGGVDKRQQRNNSEEEKQGKEWKNRQVRTEDGRTYNGGYSNVYDQPNDQERPLRQEKNFGRGRNGRKNNNGEGQGFDGEVGEREESASTQGPKPGRGRGRGRNDNGRKLWGGSEQSERPGRESAPAPVKNEQKAEKESSPVATPSITSSGKEDEQTQRDRLMEQLMKGVYECMTLAGGVQPAKQPRQKFQMPTSVFVANYVNQSGTDVTHHIHVERTCPCGAKSQDVRCSITEPFVCEGVCGKVLNCGGHTCEKLCHSGPCGDCQQEVMQSECQ